MDEREFEAYYGMTKDDAIAHYGVKGMKWGVIRDRITGSLSNTASTDSSPSAPKAPSERSVRRNERRQTRARALTAQASKLDVTIGELQSDIDKLPPGLRTSYQRSQLKGSKKELTQARDKLQRDAEAIGKGKLTRNQKLLIAGAIGVAVVGAGIYASTKVDSGEFNSMKLRGAAFLRGEKFDFKKNDAFGKNMGVDDVFSNVVKGTNPNYKTPGGSMNCRRSSMAYEMRRRGYDVVATTSAVGNGQSESGLINALTPGQRNVTRIDSMSSMVVNPLQGIRGQVTGDKRKNPATTRRVDTPTDYRKLLDGFKDMPNGSRGEIVFDFSRFGHSMSWEVFDGKPVIFDTQKANRYNVDENHISQMMKKWGQANAAEITRLDNMALDKAFVARWVTNA